MDTKLKKKTTKSAQPLRDLNGSRNRSKSSSISSDTVASIKATKGSSRSLLFSNSTNSSSSSSSRTIDLPKNRVPKKRTAPVISKAMPRSNQNEQPKKPLPLRSNKNLTRQIDIKPSNIGVQRSKLSYNKKQPVNKKKGFEDAAAMVSNLKENSSNELPVKSSGVVGICISEVKTGRGSDFYHSNVGARKDSNLKECSGNNSATPVKTPPIEASLSPEIQCGAHFKMVVSGLGATPVCYGAGHILSGVTDKRKCRRRGSLRGGDEKTNLFFDGERNSYGSVVDELMPLPSEASVRWISSPCDVGKEDGRGFNQGNVLDLEQCGTIGDDDSVVVDNLLSSPLTVGENVSVYAYDESKCGFSGTLSDVQDERIAKKDNVASSNSEFSADSLSSKNVIQTPDPYTSSDGRQARPELENHHRSSIEFEVDSITETLTGMYLSLGNEISMWDVHVCSQTNMDSLSSSWISDFALDNSASLSQMMISWRDGLRNRIEENDESDCCRCFSDEEIDALQCSDKKIKLESVSASNDNEEKDMNSELSSPVLLEYEPYISSTRQDRLRSSRNNECAESICTNGGDLIASGDSDWPYFK